MSMAPLAVTAAPAPAWLAVLLRAHDRLTGLGVHLAMVGLAVVVGAYVLEVVLRYGFNSPTRWSADLVSYLLLFITFMAMPQVTASGGHVAVTALLERMSPSRQRAAARVIAAGGVIACLLLTWISLQETMRQVSGNVQMMSANPIPKAWVSIWIVYGLGSSALHFLRTAIWPPASPIGAGANV
jgi:TRAP-type C4-dicarboxylate transport system permease small subunit